MIKMDEYEKNFEAINSILKDINTLLKRHDKDIEKLKNQHNKNE